MFKYIRQLFWRRSKWQAILIDTVAKARHDAFEAGYKAGRKGDNNG